MKTLICIVEHVFEIAGRGCVVMPGVPDSLHAVAGAPVVLKRPDGSRLAATIRGPELGGRVDAGGMPILLAELTKAEVPIGTEVWLAWRSWGRHRQAPGAACQAA